MSIWNMLDRLLRKQDSVPPKAFVTRPVIHVIRPRTNSAKPFQAPCVQAVVTAQGLKQGFERPDGTYSYVDVDEGFIARQEKRRQEKRQLQRLLDEMELAFEMTFDMRRSATSHRHESIPCSGVRVRSRTKTLVGLRAVQG